MADVKLAEACKELGMSKFWFYRLPKNTPGVYRYGRAIRINVEEFRRWARGQANSNPEINGGEP